MAKPKPEIKFKPVEWKILPEWYVLVTLPDGKELRIGGFKTEANARDWIAKSSAAWIKEQRGRWAARLEALDELLLAEDRAGLKPEGKGSSDD